MTSNNDLLEALFLDQSDLVTRNYVSLNDIVGCGPFVPKGFNWGELFKAMYIVFGPKYDKDLIPNVDTEETDELLKSFIWPRYSSSYIAYYDGTSTSDREAQLSEKMPILVGKMVAWLHDSGSRYIPLIQMNKYLESKWLDNISSETSSTFNDTPQTPNGDEYISNITKVKSETSGGTPMERFEEVRKKIRCLYEDWAKEFSQYVIYA